MLRERFESKRYFRAGSVLKISRSVARDGAGVGGFQNKVGLVWVFVKFCFLSREDNMVDKAQEVEAP